MRKPLRLFCLLLVLVLTACAVQKKPQTLGDLAEIEIKIDTTAPILGARNKAMDNYFEFVADSKQNSLKVEAMRRLADLEMERGEERLEYQMDLLDRGELDEDTDLQTLKIAAYSGAIKLYQDAIKVSTQNIQSAELHYQLSNAYEQAGYQEKSLSALNKVLTFNANVKKMDELQFRRGELLFDLRQFTSAEMAYRLAMKSGEKSPYFEKALTKRSWAIFKQSKFKRAIDSFFELVDKKYTIKKGLAGQPDKALSRGDQELVDDVFRVVMLAFNEIGGAEAIEPYFKTYGKRDYELRVYSQLAEFYIKQERKRDAAATYYAFSKAYPMHEQAFEFDGKAINIYASSGFSSLLMGAKQEFIQRYRMNGTFWKHHEEEEYTVLEKLKSILIVHSEDIIRHYHAQAQKTKLAGDYQKAFMGYRRHLKWFAQGTNARGLNFLYAELLFEAKQYESAVKEFEKTAYQYVRFGKDAEAGYAALLVYAELEKSTRGKQKEMWSRVSVGSSLRFGKTFPSDKRASGVLTKVAQDMFALNKFDQAAVAAREILELAEGAKSNARVVAWKIIARAEFEKGDYTRAEVAYKVALSLLGKNDSDRRLLEDSLAAAVYKQGEYMRSKGNIQAAIAQFSRVRQVSPNSPIVAAADFDVAVSLVQSKKWIAAIKKLTEFRRSRPNHPLSEKVTDNLLKVYLETNEYEKAAGELEIIAKSSRSPEIRRTAAWQIAEMYQKLDDRRLVIASFKQYIKMFPSPMEQATEARNMLADIYAKTGDKNMRRYWLTEIIRSDKENQGESSQRTQYLAATSSFELAQPMMALYQQVKLVEPLRVNLKRKKKRLEDAVEAYTLAANYGIAEITTASVYWLAEIYNEFGQELMNSERPPGLTEEELEQYDILLEEQAYPFEEKSINIHASNVERIFEGTYNEWIKKSLNKLKLLSPIRYAKRERRELSVALIY